jgi:hypothetical protein
LPGLPLPTPDFRNVTALGFGLGQPVQRFAAPHAAGVDAFPGILQLASAIQMADADGNDATAVDAAWAPALPTPNHPEYPAAHSCTSGSVGEALRSFYGTPEVTFSWDSKVTKTTRSYAGIEAFNAEAGIARIRGGMHFRHSIVAGKEPGRRVAQWVTARHFARQD